MNDIHRQGSKDRPVLNGTPIQGAIRLRGDVPGEEYSRYDYTINLAAVSYVRQYERGSEVALMGGGALFVQPEDAEALLSAMGLL